MRKSFSKIRHIQESNNRLEKRTLVEKKQRSFGIISEESFDESKDELINKIIEMDAALNEDPKYQEFEKKYAMKKLKDTLIVGMGMDEDEIPDEMVEMMLSMASAASKQKITPEVVMQHKESVINTVSEILEMCEEEQEFELCEKLKEFIDLLEQA